MLLLLTAVMLFYESGAGAADGKELAVMFLIIIAPAFTLFTLFAAEDSRPR